LSGGEEEITKTPVAVRPVSRPDFEPETFEYRAGVLNASPPLAVFIDVCRENQKSSAREVAVHSQEEGLIG
jgi:hypothetical protein